MSLIRFKKIDIKLRIITLLMILIAVSSLSFCSQSNYGSPGGLIDDDVVEDLDIPTYTEDVDVFLWTPDIGPEPECLECKWYFCPPLNEVW